jgi:hypothetical protein
VCERPSQTNHYAGRLGGNCGPPRIVLGAVGASTDDCGGILCLSDFSKSPEIMKHFVFCMCPMVIFDEARRNRCPVISHSSVYKTRRFLFAICSGRGRVGSIWNFAN